MFRISFYSVLFRLSTGKVRMFLAFEAFEGSLRAPSSTGIA